MDWDNELEGAALPTANRDSANLKALYEPERVLGLARVARIKNMSIGDQESASPIGVLDVEGEAARHAQGLAATTLVHHCGSQFER